MIVAIMIVLLVSVLNLGGCARPAQSTDPETIVKTYESLTRLGDIQTTYGPAYVGGLKTAGINRIMCAPSPISRVTDGKSTNVKYVMFDIP
jgi:hypothetical protein